MITALSTSKGGAGKTTLAVCLAAWWRSQGHRTLLCDADPQRSALTYGEQARAAGQPAPTIVAMGEDLWRQEQLPTLASNYDQVVIDCPPRLGKIMRAALLAADVALVPWRPGPSDAWALAETLEVLAAAREYRPDLVAAAVLVQVDSRTALGRGARESLVDSGIPVLDTTIGLRVGYAEALAMGQGVTDYAPKSTAADEIRALALELEELASRSR